MKPKMRLDPEKDLDGHSMIVRAASILHAHGFKQEAKMIHQEASVNGYEENAVFRILKKYVEI